MLRFLKQVLIWLGVIFILTTIGLMVWDIIQINQLVAVANANKSNAAGFNPNPRNWVMLAAGVGLVGGLLLGLGLGMPRRTFKQRLQDRTEQAASQAIGLDHAANQVSQQIINDAIQPPLGR